MELDRFCLDNRDIVCVCGNTGEKNRVFPFLCVRGLVYGLVMSRSG